MLAKVVMVMIGCLVCGAAVALPQEIADCKVYKLWQFDKSAEGWRPDHNVGPFTLKESILSFKNTGSDPWIVNNKIGGMDTSKYGFLGMRVRSSAAGSNQVYFATDKSPLGESTVTSFPVRGDGEWHFYEINLYKLKTWTGKLNVLRMDPVNGGSEVGAKVDIDWIALYQTPARVVMGRPEVRYDSPDRRTLLLSLKNVGGEPTSSDIALAANEAKQKVKPIKPGETLQMAIGLKPSSTGYSARAQSGAKTLFEIALMSDMDESRAKEWNLSDCMCIHLAKRAAWAHIDGADIALPAPLTPLGVLVYRDGEGVLHYDQLVPDTVSVKGGTATLLGKHKLARGTATVQWTMTANSIDPDATVGAKGEIICQLSTDTPLGVLRFEGPRLIESWPRTHALFPGLQYLEQNEAHTALDFIGPKLADQHIPHPYKIAVPLMAVETKDGVVGMSWDPLQEWAPGQKLPCAEFQPDKGLMTIFAPSIPDFVQENQEYAATPYTLKPGEKMTLRMSFFTEAGKKIEDVIPEYLKSHPLKRTVDAKMVEKVVDTCFKAYAGTLYSPKDKGWKNHFGLHQNYTFLPHFAANVLAESIRKGDPELARKVDLDPNAQLAQYTGTSMDWFNPGACAGADAAVARMSPDGGFPYQIDDEMRKKTRDYATEHGGIDVDTLGRVGETNSGLICRELGGILTCALRTGEKKYIDAGLKGLEKLNSFTVPRGAQTWEVHAHAPDVYAAGLAVSCNLDGYHLTGDKKYLDYATFWAKTGLPFVYTWIPPLAPPSEGREDGGYVPAGVLHFDENGEGPHPTVSKPGDFYTNTKRYVNPGATIAVMGSTFYFVNWFGTPVQWCGLAWADMVQALLRLRPDPILQSAADAVFVSGAQQQFDKGWAAGTYPDSWTLASNTANTAFITPDTILTYAYGWLGEPRNVSTAGLKLESGMACLNTFARIESISPPSSQEGARGRFVQAKLKYYAGQDVYSCMAKVDRPAKVEIDGVELAAADDLKSAASGWLYDAEKKALHVKYRSKDRVAEMRVEW